MNVIITNGFTFWNAENNCWTYTISAATRFDHIDKLPDSLPISNTTSYKIYLEAPPSGLDKEYSYLDQDDEKQAWLREV